MSCSQRGSGPSDLNIFCVGTISWLSPIRHQTALNIVGLPIPVQYSTVPIQGGNFGFIISITITFIETVNFSFLFIS